MGVIQHHLREHGWARVEKVFSEGELEKIAERVRYHATRQLLDLDNPTLTDISSNGLPTTRKLSEPFFLDPLFRRLAFDPRIIQLIAPVVGPGPELLFDHVFMKPARCGTPKYWHQDGFYYDIEPPDKGVSVWVALHDADKGNGCLNYYEGTHHSGLLPHDQPGGEPAHARISIGSLELGTPVAVPASRGDVILHYFHTVHGSGANKTVNDRWAYSSHWIGKGVEGGGASWSKTYPLRMGYQELIEKESLRG